MTRYSRWTLDNGLRVLHAHRPWNKTFAAMLGFGVGWRDEARAERGLTHLLEHLALSGDNELLVDSLAEQGLGVNGSTEWEQTHFPTGGHRDLLEPALDLYARILRGIEVDEQAIAAELPIILQELLHLQDSPFDQEMRRLTARILGDSEIGAPFPRSIKNLARMDPADMRRYARAHFTATNAILTIVSPNDPEELRTTLNEKLARIAGARVEPGAPTTLEIAGSDRPIVKRYNTPQVHLVATYAYRPRQRHPLAVVSLLNELLGGGPHSLLFKSLRREASLLYHFGTGITILEDAVLLQVSALVHRRNAAATLEQVFAACDGLRDGSIREEAFELGRTRMLHALDALEDDSSHLCEWLAHQSWISDDELTTPETYRDQLEKLTQPAFEAVAADLFAPERRTLALFGGVGLRLRWRVARLLRTAERAANAADAA